LQRWTETTNELDKAVAEALDKELKRRRKYAAFFDFSDKKAKERGVVTTLLESMERKGAAVFRGPVQSVDEKDQWPDCRAVDVEGRNVAFEVTELVSQEAIEANQHVGDKWCWWSDADVVGRLEKILQEKDQCSFHGNSFASVVLVIHTDEPTLEPDKIDSLLKGHIFPKLRNIEEVYLLMSYSPKLGGGYYPYFKLGLSSE